MPRRSSTRAPVRPASKVPRRDGTVLYVRYSQRIAREICERIAAGEVWYRICNTGRLPSYVTLYKWLERYPDFAEAFAQAREMAADLRADKALMVAEAATPATVTADRLHVSALQWHAAKASPGRYGSGGRGGASDDPDEAGPPRLIIEVRRFERAWRPDGKAYVREVTPLIEAANTDGNAGGDADGDGR